jgi:chromodomain-helicase-DNA-binding protein 4
MCFYIFVKDQKTDVFVQIFLFSDRDESSPRMKRRTEEIASAEHTVEAGLEALSRDATEEGEIGT